MTAWWNYPITHGYLTNYAGPGTDTPHFAVDLGMPQDTPVTAIKSGTVEQADYATWSGQPGGGEVFIKPDDGSPEYYFYHFDQNKVAAGQHVTAGQLVGLSGGQNSGGSHPVSSMWSTGPHLHLGYFTGFKSTPAGSRPAGPDITPTIQAMRVGGIPSMSNSAAASTGGNLGSSIQNGLTKVAIFLIALVLVGAGFYLVFSKQINSAVGSGIKAGKKLAEVAAVAA